MTWSENGFCSACGGDRRTGKDCRNESGRGSGDRQRTDGASCCGPCPGRGCRSGSVPGSDEVVSDNGDCSGGAMTVCDSADENGNETGRVT